MKVSVKHARKSENERFRGPLVKFTVYINKAPSNGLKHGRPAKLSHAEGQAVQY